MKSPFNRLRIDHWSWVHAKAVLFVCGFLYFVETPPSHLEELGYFLTDLVALFIMMGSVVSVIGLVISTSEDRTKVVTGLEIERFGLGIALCGPVIYTLVQLTLVSEVPSAITRACFSYALAAFIAARFVVIHRALNLRR